ncbi:MAG: ATP-dependent zinc metalloprotease FtsH [Okeania sp. SIO3I5]|uniref:ATP-dependent zinc metalloprotease FtsH n=1 Tax=Okeania sp. SIO3I5 TaxID=2607805 RepID=UPI0013B914BC|nr:ATP-dependent zinc metalloprotease FtsH [Okeania sp. SIO3I5]NEQ40275.1 ATP-dependent zinc metalloprotease FtsH [Okeania sp. SIO3I5]
MSIKKNPKNSRNRQIGSALLILAVVLLAAYFLIPRRFMTRRKLPRIPYSVFLQQVESGQVTEVRIDNQQIIYLIKEENKPESSIASTTRINDPQLLQRLVDNKVLFGVSPRKNPWFAILLNWVIPPIILVLALQFLMNRGPQGSLSISKSKAKVYVEGESEKITFTDIAGVEEAKTELTEIVDFLKSPKRFTAIGAKIPKGLLLVGPPGTGKTLLAKAVAGEAGVPFFSISGSEFVELFVGTGAARVRDLFKQAKKKAPCIIFIDEIDAIGKSRSNGNSQSGSNDEREQTLNQLLTEMDGFGAGDLTVIVLAATNRPEALDAALLRPGRFDRQVLVDRPDLVGREAILKIYAKKVKLGENVDLHKVARITSGFGGADLANLVNEAALLAARNKREYVEQQDFAEAIERVIGGLERKSRVLSDREKKIVAYHEVGHALVGALMPGSSKVEKISIVPRGMAALGYTLQLPTEDRFLRDEEEIKGQIATLLGGRAAEEIVFGNITTGAVDDLQKATFFAEKMLTIYGMSKVLGNLVYEWRGQESFLGNNGGNPRRFVSTKTQEAIDNELKEIVEKSYQQALDILNHNRDLLENISQQILEKEVIEGEDLNELLKEARSPWEKI